MDKYAIPGHYRKFRDPRGEELAAEYDRLMHEKLDQKGALYSVSLDVDPDDLLDWDAPLSQQSEKVRKAWSGFSTFVRDNAFVGPGSKETTGEAMYKSLVREYGGLEAASRALAEAGIPGLRYFDGGSRGKGEGTRNVVMFRDDLVKIEGVE